ncbi:MAG: hypothetical protein HC869_07990 [Rhodospirillales bacterium]|nr:hypothetical protein [Rhodospirillales bacterium]
MTQNTIDAKTAAPARIRFKRRRVPVRSLPGLDDLIRAVDSCAEAAIEDGSSKAEKFFAAAKTMLKGKDISILQVRDSNTTGLVGPCRYGTPFFAMLKATGQSRKDDTSSGSYGIGKFAPFTVSELRTVFVSTVWKDEDDNLHHYVQGKSVLMSHRDAADSTRRGTGFWGIEKNCAPVIGMQECVPEWLRFADDAGEPAATGTMLTILGFQPDPNWQKMLAANITENFFGAISRGELEVDIDGVESITKATLRSTFNDNEIIEAAKKQSYGPDRFERAAYYLWALQDDPEVIVEKHENQHLGECHLRILVGENLPRRVAVLRNGMLITESPYRLKRFNDFKEFIAVLECPTEKGSSLLRAMEPPRHDAFEPDRLPLDERRKGKVALNDLADWVRKMLKRHAKDPVKEETPLDELADMFADDEDPGLARKKDENPGGAITIRARRVKPKSAGAPIGGIAPSVEEEEGGTEGLGRGEGADEGTGSGGSGQGGSNEAEGGDSQGSDGGADKVNRTLAKGLPLGDVRAIPLDAHRRRVAFTPETTGTVVLELQESGADTNYALTVADSDKGVINKGQIDQLAVTAGERCVLVVTLESEFAGTLRVVANETVAADAI